jgi:hypothetical protein
MAPSSSSAPSWERLFSCRIYRLDQCIRAWIGRNLLYARAGKLLFQQCGRAREEGFGLRVSVSVANSPFYFVVVAHLDGWESTLG